MGLQVPHAECGEAQGGVSRGCGHVEGGGPGVKGSCVSMWAYRFLMQNVERLREVFQGGVVMWREGGEGSCVSMWLRWEGCLVK